MSYHEGSNWQAKKEDANKPLYDNKPATQPSTNTAVEDELRSLRQWKKEATLLLDQIYEYADGHPAIKLGMSKITFVIERARKYDEVSAIIPDDAVPVEPYEPNARLRYWKERALKAESNIQGAVWVKASERLPLHKAFWNIPDGYKKDCYFPVRIDGNKYWMAEIFDERNKEEPEPRYCFTVRRGGIEEFYEDEWHRIEWLDESGTTTSNKSDAVEFAKFCADYGEKGPKGSWSENLWQGNILSGEPAMTTEQLYEQFKNRK